MESTDAAYSMFEGVSEGVGKGREGVGAHQYTLGAKQSP